MLLNILNYIVQNLTFFTGAYSNNVFPEQLSKELEDEYIKKAKSGDKEARNKLIEHNLRLVAHIVKKFEATGHDIDDLIGIGTVGLIKGIDTYSENKKVKLATYAAKCAENEILMYFRADKKNSKNVSLYEEISYDKEGNKITILDILKTGDIDYIEEIYKNDNIKLLRKYLNVLTKRERDIIEARYGLNNKKEQTQKDIAKKLDISRSYVSRLEKRATTKILREFLKNQKNINN
ncbi:MAG: RNA polymerase sporulation sigma factor SigK [Erysipelotrichaceae bacterium]|nr:RNA polymerase sporulation sigma factor SigK [Erysipelotrichaceae bacterium]MDY3934907.1 RNA polymerase sporulation sigma factor SigK [Bacilli bacterium]